MVVRTPVARTEGGLVELLATEVTGTVFGYRLVGAEAGPQVVVAGACPSAETVFQRLLSIPTLPWMRGNLVLIRLDKLEDAARDMATMTSLEVVDHTVVLPSGGADAPEGVIARRNYQLVLRTCAQLGMISGRGVARG